MMVGIGATIGKVAQINNHASCNQQITGITLRENMVNTDFATYLLKTLETTIRKIAPSATIAIFNQGNIGSLFITVPPLSEQKEISAYIKRGLKKIHSVIHNIQHSTTLLQEYRSSLIHSAVTGKIDLRGYHEEH